MKRGFIAVISFAFILLAGCGTSQKGYYQSTADLDNISRSTLTNAKLIKWPEEKKYPFGVVVATDINSSNQRPYNYALFVPSASTSSINEISNLRIEFAVAVNKEDLEYFAIEVDKILRSWSSKSTVSEATYYDFYSAPDKNISQKNSDDQTWYPSIRFGYQNTSKGSVGELTIGPDSFRFKYKFDEMTELASFQWVLSEAINELRALEKD
jgi:hypothetical protein